MLSVLGGLTLLSSASPLAAQANPSATRSLSAAEVAPEGTLTVTISVADLPRNIGVVTETLPPGFAYVLDSTNLGDGDDQVAVSGQNVAFTL